MLHQFLARHSDAIPDIAHHCDVTPYQNATVTSDAYLVVVGNDRFPRLVAGGVAGVRRRRFLVVVMYGLLDAAARSVRPLNFDLLSGAQLPGTTRQTLASTG